MPQYLAPGVYVEEVSSGPAPIEGVGTNTAGFVGVTRRGPIEGPPTLVTSYAEFIRAFGGAFDFPGFADWRDLPGAMRGFFDNGGQRAYIARVAAATVAGDTSAATLTGGVVTRLARDTAIEPVAAQNVARLVSLRGIAIGTTIVLRMTRQGVTTTSPVLTIDDLDRDTGEVTLDIPISTTEIFEAAHTVVHTDVLANLDAGGLPVPLADPTAPKPDTFSLAATSPGTWGQDVRVAPAAESAARSRVVALVNGDVDANAVQLLSTAGFYVGAWVEIDLPDRKRYREVLAIDGPVLTLAGPALVEDDVDPAGGPANVSTCEFALAITYTDPTERVTVSERFGGMTLANVAGRFYLDRLTASTLVAVTGAAPADTHPLLFPSAPDGLTAALSGGADNLPNALDVIGLDNGPNRKTGLLAIEDVDEVAILAAPGLTMQAVQNALINQCERLMDRFAVLDPVGGTGGTPATLTQIRDQRALYDTKYAALYYPRVVVPDPLLAGASRVLAPSGHVLGVYSRVDATRGVHKAPANEVIRGILDVETAVSKGAHEIFNPDRINIIRDLRPMQRGLRIYGALCLTGESEWKYINVRRFFIFVEESLDEGTQWVVFEPNDRRLWQRVKQSVSLFLTRLWADGALMGDSPEEAYFVRVDETTMTEDDILNGRLIMEIGIAPVRPAEFVVIRIGQWLGGSSVQEI